MKIFWNKKYIVAASLIIVLLVVSSAIGLEISSTPFGHNLWKKGVSGDIGSSTASSNAFFVSIYEIENKTMFMSHLYNYSVEALNITTGNLLWESKAIQFYGNFQFESSKVKSPILWYSNNTVYLLGYNLWIVPEQNLTTLDLYSFNSTNGHLISKENLTAPFSSSNNKTDFSGIYPESITASFEQSHLSLSYLVIHTNISNYETKSTNYFQSIFYSLKNGSASDARTVNITFPPINSYGTGSISVHTTSSIQVLHLQWVNGTIVENTKTGKITVTYLPISDINVRGQNVYVSNQSSGRISVYVWNSTTNITTKLFSFFNQILSKYPGTALYSMNVIGNLRFSFQIFGRDGSGNNIPVYPNPDVQFIGYTSQGICLWNISEKSFPLGTFTSTNLIGNNDLLLTYMGSSPIYGTHSNFLIVNYTSGDLLWQKSFGYRVNEPSGNAAFLSPMPFNGIIGAINGYVLYKLGTSLACAYLGNL